MGGSITPSPALAHTPSCARVARAAPAALQVTGEPESEDEGEPGAGPGTSIILSGAEAERWGNEGFQEQEGAGGDGGRERPGSRAGPGGGGGGGGAGAQGERRAGERVQLLGRQGRSERGRRGGALMFALTSFLPQHAEHECCWCGGGGGAVCWSWHVGQRCRPHSAARCPAAAAAGMPGDEPWASSNSVFALLMQAREQGLPQLPPRGGGGGGRGGGGAAGGSFGEEEEPGRGGREAKEKRKHKKVCLGVRCLGVRWVAVGVGLGAWGSVRCRGD